MSDLATVRKHLEDMLDIQLADGNWNYDAYQMGLANGLILSLALVNDAVPVFLERPIKWLSEE